MNDSDNKGMTDFESRLQQQMRDSEQSISAERRQQLNSARNRALNKSNAKSPIQFLMGSNWGMATACSLFIMIGVVTFNSQIPDISTAADAQALLVETESLELYENLEFYQWLEETEVNQG